MSLDEMPTFSKSAYTTKTYDPMGYCDPRSPGALLMGHPAHPGDCRVVVGAGSIHLADVARQMGEAKLPPHQPKPHQPKEPAMRIVKVYIADPNENLPLTKRVLYSGAEQLTDLTDQELFFEIDLKALLKGHNDTRILTVDKKASERAHSNVYLEPVRVRDLKMVVVDVATF
jgi:hypothetical protein